MRILFTSRGSAGHVGPLAPYARAAAQAGHDVLLAAQPRFAGNVERLGLPFAPLADPPEHEWGPLMARLPEAGFDEANAQMLSEFFGRIDTEAALPPLRALIRRWQPDLLVRESWEFAAALAAELHGLPIANVALGVAEMEEHTTVLVARTVDRLRRRHGLPPDPEGDRLRRTPTLTVMPKALEDPAVPPPCPMYRFRHDDPPPPTPLPNWWPGIDGPLVYVTFGSVTAQEQMPYYPTLYRAVIDALAPLGVRVLVTVGEPRDLAELGDLPPNVHVEHWVPQHVVLPHATAIVGHGGHGTTVGALHHGVPAAVLPLFSIDQWANAGAVARAGTGVALASAKPQRPLHVPGDGDLARVRAAVELLLRDGPERRASRSIAAQMRALPPVDAAVDLFASLAAQSSGEAAALAALPPGAGRRGSRTPAVPSSPPLSRRSISSRSAATSR